MYSRSGVRTGWLVQGASKGQGYHAKCYNMFQKNVNRLHAQGSPVSEATAPGGRNSTVGAILAAPQPLVHVHDGSLVLEDGAARIEKRTATWTFYFWIISFARISQRHAIPRVPCDVLCYSVPMHSLCACFLCADCTPML